MLPVADPIDVGATAAPAVVAFVGATGVGKTTTVAKLAADARLKRNRSVGLITTDTHRIAAHEQLRTYAEIIDVPLRVASTPDEMAAALAALRDADLVLIDTAGVSPKNTEIQGELRSLLSAAGACEVHLVLPATGSADALSLTIDRFGPLGVNRLLFTKLDEAVGFGVILNCLQRTEAKLSYITDGQRVPEDIHRGGSARIAELIVGSPSVSSFDNVEGVPA
jgi:flagellar biosynthesis protein FlhF